MDRPSRAMGRIVLLGGSAIAISACSLLIDVSGLTSSDPPAVDGGAEASLAEGVQTAACTKQPSSVFCDDFDERPLPGPWDKLVAVAGTGRLAGDGSQSPPNAFVVTLDPADPAGNVRLQKDFGVVPNALHLAFDWRVDAIDPNAGRTVRAAEVQLISDEGYYYLQFGINSDRSLYFDDQRVPTGTSGEPVRHHPLSISATVGSWMHVQIDARLGASSFTVSVEGRDVASGSLTPLSSQARVTLYLGATYTPDPSAGWQLRYDNVTFAMD